MSQNNNGAFQAKYKQLEATKDTEYTDPEDRDEYAAANIFWVPKEARWAKLQHKDLRADFILANPPFNMSDRRGCTLFIDARKLGNLIDRTHKDFSDEEIDKVAATEEKRPANTGMCRASARAPQPTRSGNTATC